MDTFDTEPVRIGSEFLVNSETFEVQREPTTTVLVGGGFVVSWQTEDPTQDGNGSAIKAQVFDDSGNKVGSEFLVNSETAGRQVIPTITSLANGGFVVSWETLDHTQDGSGNAVKAQVFDASGNTVG